MKKHTRPAFAGRGINFLTREQMEKIHSATLQLMQETGIVVQHKGALELLEKAGCRVVKKHVYFTPSIVEWAIKTAPSRILLYDRDGNFAMDCSGRNTYYGVGSAEPRIIDPYTGEQRLCNEEDNKNCVKVADAMPYIDYMMSLCQVYDHPKTSYEHEYAAMIRYSSKPQVVITNDLESTKNVVEMAAVARGGIDKLQQKPLFILYCEPTSPMVCTRESIDKVMYMAEMNLPVLYAPIPMNGATGPITMAGSIVQANAECLAGLVIAQLTNPGCPFLFGAIITNMDLKSLQPTYASPETQIESLALSEIGRDLYKLPTWGTAGCTSSKMADDLMESIEPYDLSQTVFTPEMVMLLEEEAERQGKEAKVHIKLDTGMSRIGFQVTSENVDLCAKIAGLPLLYAEGIFSHFATADETDLTKTKKQAEKIILLHCMSCCCTCGLF